MTDVLALLRDAAPFVEDPDTIEKDPKTAKALSKQLAESDDALAKEAAPYVADASHGTTREARHILTAIRRRLKPTVTKQPRMRDVMYPYRWEWRHGDGHTYGCGQVVVTYDATNTEEIRLANESMAKHRAACSKTDHDKAAPAKGRAKKGKKK